MYLPYGIKYVIIGITGKKRSGKDTISEYFEKKYKFTRNAFADPIKGVCREMFGCRT